MVFNTIPFVAIVQDVIIGRLVSGMLPYLCSPHRGITLATFQYSDAGFDEAPGGLVEFDPAGAQQ
jgi:hypothetical protein